MNFGFRRKGTRGAGAKQESGPPGLVNQVGRYNHSQARKGRSNPIVVTLVMWKVKNSIGSREIKKIHKKPKNYTTSKSIGRIGKQVFYKKN
jgi:hypothetical protein